MSFPLQNVLLRRSALLAVVLSQVGCATVPRASAPRPWIDVTPGSVVPTRSEPISIQATGVNHSLLGVEDPRHAHIAGLLATTLTERGYDVVPTAATQTAVLRYSTSPTSRLSAESELSNSSYRVGSASALGVGAFVAHAVYQSTSSSSVAQRVEEVAVHGHQLALEFRDGDRVVWVANAVWESSAPDLGPELDFALALMVSTLPVTASAPTDVPAIKDSHIDAYYEEHCEDRPLRSIALPHYVQFPDTTATGVPGRIKDPSALPAFTDLITSAEIALPIGTEDWTKPTSQTLWSTVLLAGQYRLGPSGTPVNAMVQLAGRPSAYTVRKAWLATDQEYAEYLAALEAWRAKVADYYDWYEK